MEPSVLLYVCVNCDLVAGSSEEPPVTLDRCPRCGLQKFTALEVDAPARRTIFPPEFDAWSWADALAATVKPRRALAGGFRGMLGRLLFRAG